MPERSFPSALLAVVFLCVLVTVRAGSSESGLCFYGYTGNETQLAGSAFTKQSLFRIDIRPSIPTAAVTFLANYNNNNGSASVTEKTSKNNRTCSEGSPEMRMAVVSSPSSSSTSTDIVVGMPGRSTSSGDDPLILYNTLSQTAFCDDGVTKLWGLSPLPSSGNNNNRGSSRGNTKRPPTGKKPTTARPSTSPSQTASFKSLTVSLQRKHSDEPLQFGKPTSIVHVQGKLRTNPIKIETVDHTLRMMYDQKLTMNSSDKSNNKTNKGNNTRGRRSGAYHERQPKHRRTLTDANKWVNNPMVQLYIERNRTTPALVEDLAEPQKPDALALAMTKRLATFVNGYEGPQVWDPPPVVSDNNNGHALLSHRTSNGSVGSNTTTTMTTAAVPSTLNNNNVNNSEENQDENDSGEYTGPTTVGDVAACQCWLCRPCTVMEFSFTPGVSTLRVRVVWLPLLMTGIL